MQNDPVLVIPSFTRIGFTVSVMANSDTRASPMHIWRVWYLVHVLARVSGAYFRNTTVICKIRLIHLL